MLHPIHTAPPLPHSCPLTERFAWMIELLRRAVSQYSTKSRPALALMAPLWLYVHRTCKRFDSLVRRWRAGKLKPRRPRAPRPEADAAAASAADPPEPRARRPRPAPLPDAFGWVLWLVPEAVHARGWLENLVADPEIAALLEASPQAARLLRPLCWMLGLEVAPDRPAVLFSGDWPQRPETPDTASFLRPPSRGWWMRRHPDGRREAIPLPTLSLKYA